MSDSSREPQFLEVADNAPYQGVRISRLVDRELSSIELALLSDQPRCPRQHKRTHQPFGRQ
jgi:hypothetical protein